MKNTGSNAHGSPPGFRFLFVPFAVLALGGCVLDWDFPEGPPLPTIERIDARAEGQIDLLFEIDNSRSMAEKQAILTQSIPDLVRGLVNPRCIDALGAPALVQPEGPNDPCPPGAVREFEPIRDMHIGVISTSLGGHGADSCPTTEMFSCKGVANTTPNDAAHLLSRSDPCGGASVPTWSNKGFLAWDPEAAFTPAGENRVGDLSQGSTGIVPSLRDMVTGVGQIGCGYEAQLESFYRFLVDPEPSYEIAIENGKAVPKGLDDVLLKQRADFLRPRSLVAIVLLSDENDCSIKETGVFYLVGQLKDPNDATKAYRMPRARKECALDPLDPCCAPCSSTPPPGCPADAACTMSPKLTVSEDHPNLRCFDQKRRFGADALYPIDRYTTALTNTYVPNRAGELVRNPLFDSQDGGRGRDRSMVLFAGIVGVPWQDIARDPNDLTQGFKNAAELGAERANGDTNWDIIVGDPEGYVMPKDPFMLESVTPRSGQNPIIVDLISPPGSAPNASKINGHEYTPSGNDDLQFACVFPLASPRDCTDPMNQTQGCDCLDPANDSPLCAPNPNDNNSRTLQVRSKAYPSLRELRLLQTIGAQGVTTSICSAQIHDPSREDFAYRPAMDAVLERVKAALSASAYCLPKALPTNEEGRVSCTLVEASQRPSCECDRGSGRAPLVGEDAAFAQAIQKSEGADPSWNCFCELIQAGDSAVDPPSSKEELFACQNDPSKDPLVSGAPFSSFCYIDADAAPALGDPALTDICPSDAQRTLRFVGEAEPRSGAGLYLHCTP